MYSSEKVLQIIGYLLSLNDNKMNLLKLMKELYLIDRESIKDTNFSITGDNYFSLDNGPVLSATLNLLNDLGMSSENNWNNYLAKIYNKYYADILLVKKTSNDELSEKDEEYIKKISDKFKDYDEWKLKDYTHSLKEWKNPKGSSKKIRFVDIMRALDKTEEEIKQSKIEYDAITELSYLTNQ